MVDVEEEMTEVEGLSFDDFASLALVCDDDGVD